MLLSCVIPEARSHLARSTSLGSSCQDASVFLLHLVWRVCNVLACGASLFVVDCLLISGGRIMCHVGSIRRNGAHREESGTQQSDKQPEFNYIQLSEPESVRVRNCRRLRRLNQSMRSYRLEPWKRTRGSRTGLSEGKCGGGERHKLSQR